MTADDKCGQTFPGHEIHGTLISLPGQTEPWIECDQKMSEADCCYRCFRGTVTVATNKKCAATVLHKYFDREENVWQNCCSYYLDVKAFNPKADYTALGLPVCNATNEATGLTCPDDRYSVLCLTTDKQVGCCGDYAGRFVGKDCYIHAKPLPRASHTFVLLAVGVACIIALALCAFVAYRRCSQEHGRRNSLNEPVLDASVTEEPVMDQSTESATHLSEPQETRPPTSTHLSEPQETRPPTSPPAMEVTSSSFRTGSARSYAPSTTSADLWMPRLNRDNCCAM